MSDALDQILQFLRSEGFYAAEDALIRELEDRLPEGDGSRSAGSSPSQTHSSPTLIPESQQPRPDSRQTAEAHVPDPTRYSSVLGVAFLSWTLLWCDSTQMVDTVLNGGRPLQRPLCTTAGVSAHSHMELFPAGPGQCVSA